MMYYIEIQDKNGRPEDLYKVHFDIFGASEGVKSIWFRVPENFTAQDVYEVVVYDGDWVKAAFPEFLARYGFGSLEKLSTKKIIKKAKAKGYKARITRNGVRIGGASHPDAWMNEVNNILYSRRK